jgi:hypothetical protein
MSKPPTYHRQDVDVSAYEGDLGDYLKGPVEGAAVAPAVEPLEINGAPAAESAHEYVMRQAPAAPALKGRVR